MGRYLHKDRRYDGQKVRNLLDSTLTQVQVGSTRVRRALSIRVCAL